MRVSKIKSAIFLNTVIFVVSCFIFSYLNYGLYHFYERKIARPYPVPSNFKNMDKFQLVTDTVAMIVHSYYVDRERAAFSSLVHLLLEKLVENQLVEVTELESGKKGGERSELESGKKGGERSELESGKKGGERSELESGKKGGERSELESGKEISELVVVRGHRQGERSDEQKRYRLRSGEQVLDVDIARMTEAKFSNLLLTVSGWLASDAELMAHLGLTGEEDCVYYVLNEFLAGLDSHSILLNRDEYSELKQGTEGQFGGIGIMVGIRDGLLTVIKPLPNSPAWRAGIKKHDRIININGQHTFEYSLDQLVKYMRGDPGTRVRLSLLRQDGMSPYEMEIKREVVQVDSIATRQLQSGLFPVLYVQVESFSTRTAGEIAQALATFRRSKTHDYGVILDLRANPGGLLDQAVQVSDLFLSRGRILSTVGRRKEVESAIYAKGETNFPLVTLIDADSASASEIVAGALQDQGRSFIIGQPSFGKGSVQTIFELPFGQALKLTIARYYTPSGRTIQDTGIYPHIWLQPVFQNDQNLNLMGSYRYKSLTAKQTLLTKEKGYYLRRVATEKDDDGKQEHDPELDTALSLLTKILRNQHRPRSFFVSDYTQALTELRPALKRMNRETEQWLRSRYQIDWQEVSSSSRFRFNIKNSMKEVLTGEPFHISWRLTNLAATSLARASIFVRADFKEFVTQEHLIGRIEANTSTAADFDFRMPPLVKSGVYKFQAGVALDGKIQEQSVRHFKIRVKNRHVPDLKIAVSLEEKFGGRVDGSIEAGEHSDIAVMVSNSSNIEADDLTIKVLNLAGQQIYLPILEKQMHNLLPGEQKIVRFPLKATRQIFSETLPLGISIVGDSLNLPVKKQHTLKARPSVIQARF